MRPSVFNIIPLKAAATTTTAAVPAEFIFQASAQIVVTGGSAQAGVLKLQASNDNPVNGTQPTNFSDISGATVTVNAAGAFLIPKQDICYNFIRLVYTNTGDGNISVNLKTTGV